MNIVGVAAWIIVGKTLWNAFNPRSNKDALIEHEAAKAEYDDLRRGNYDIDETWPEWRKRQQLEHYRERQQQLLLRYPQTLIDPPPSHYRKQAKEKYEEDHRSPSWREWIRTEWKGILVFVLSYGAIWGIIEVIKSLF